MKSKAQAFLMAISLSLSMAHAQARAQVRSIEKSARDLQQLKSTDFAPLGCNSNLASISCERWTTRYGSSATRSKRVKILCGECFIMDHPGPSLTLEDGMDIRGKLVFPDGYKLEIFTPLVVVQGELLIEATKPIDGLPSIKFVMTGEEDRAFQPVRENSGACGGVDCNAGKKGFVVAGGVVQLRGIPENAPTWVTLYDAPDDLSVIVDSSVIGKWGAGSEILLTSHTRNSDDHQTRTIVNVVEHGTDGKFVLLEMDAAIERPTTSSDSVDFAVEVALLSRNILFTGGSDATDNHGGHFWIRDTPGVQQHIEGVDFQNFGQQGTLGRYPIHFHFCGDVDGAVVLKNTIRQSNQRCIVVHGTNNLLVEGNVAYNTAGHCFVLEDGIETGNKFFGNLGAQTNIPSVIIPNSGTNGIETDSAPSTFWITNPSNSFVGNVAAGSEGSGFWLELLKRGPRASQFPHLNPKYDSLLLFTDNVAHSNRRGFQTYPSGYLPHEQAAFMGLKSYRNRNGMFFHLSQNLLVDGALFADNHVGLEIDRADNVVVTDSTFIGQSQSYENFLQSRPFLDPCGSPHVAIELHTHKQDPTQKGVLLERVHFTGYEHIPCNDVVIFSLDEKTKTGSFDMYTSLKELLVEPYVAPADFCRADDNKITDLYLTDLDGSLRPDGMRVMATATTTATLLSDHPSMLNFLDPSQCQSNENRCYSYCNACFRSVRLETSPSLNYLIKVCSINGDQAPSNNCIFLNGYTRDIQGKNTDFSAQRPRTYMVHLPYGQYNLSFVDETGHSAWPSFVNTIYEDVLCPDSISSEDVSLLVPPLFQGNSNAPGECSELIRNGDMESESEGSHWLYWKEGMEIVHGGGTSRSNGLSSLDTSDSAYLVQFVDSRCIQSGSYYQLQAEVKLTNADGIAYACNSETRKCPVIGIITENGFKVIATVNPSANVGGFQQAIGYLRIDDTLADATQIGFYVRSSVKNKMMTIDNVEMSQVDHALEFCANLIRGDSVGVEWISHWVSNSKTQGSIMSVTVGNNPNSAFLYGNRGRISAGPRYNGFREIDEACLTPNSVWRVEAQLQLLDRNTGLGAGCELNKANSCPSLLFEIVDKSGKKVLFSKQNDYAISLWHIDNLNAVEVLFTLPGNDEWDGSVGRATLEIRDFPAHLDLVVGSVSFRPAL